MSELWASLLKICASVALLVFVLYVAAALARATRMAPEMSRKLIHVSLGFYALSFPILFAQVWEVALTCAFALGVFALARGRLRAELGAGLHAVSRRTYGELCFAIAVAALFGLNQAAFADASAGWAARLGNVLYVAPLLILTVSDAAAALVGVRYGRHRFIAADGAKTWEGVAAFAASAWVICFAAFMVTGALSALEAAMVSLNAACVGALLELAGWRGLDNLIIPLGLYGLFLLLGAATTLNWAAAWGVLAVSALGFAMLASAQGKRRPGRIAFGIVGSVLGALLLALPSS